MFSSKWEINNSSKDTIKTLIFRNRMKNCTFLTETEIRRVIQLIFCGKTLKTILMVLRIDSWGQQNNAIILYYMSSLDF